MPIMAAPRKYPKYPDELRERAISLAVEARQDRAARTGAVKCIADQLDVHPEALRTWVKRGETDKGVRPGTTSRHRERLAVVYVRQSTRQQVEGHQESTRLQYALVDRAVTLGWEVQGPGHR
jgi:transposase-like protein